MECGGRGRGRGRPQGRGFCVIDAHKGLPLLASAGLLRGRDVGAAAPTGGRRPAQVERGSYGLCVTPGKSAVAGEEADADVTASLLPEIPCYAAKQGPRYLFR